MPGHWIKYGGHPNPTSWIAQGKDNLQLIEKNPNRLQLAELKKPGPGGGGDRDTNTSSHPPQGIPRAGGITTEAKIILSTLTAIYEIASAPFLYYFPPRSTRP